MNAIRSFPGRYAKFVTAALGQALVFAQVTYGGHNRWVQLATAMAVAVGVLAVPNTPVHAAPVPPPAPPVPPAPAPAPAAPVP